MAVPILKIISQLYLLDIFNLQTTGFYAEAVLYGLLFFFMFSEVKEHSSCKDISNSVLPEEASGRAASVMRM